MLNIIHSDIFRLRKNKTILYAAIGAMAVVLLAGLLQFLVANNIWDMGNEAVYLGIMPIAQNDQLPDNAAEFALYFLGIGVLPFFVLIFIVAIIGADYSHGTLQNTLAFETNRRVVYIAKFVSGVLCSMFLTIACIIFSWIAGLALFGFGGFNWEYFERLVYSILLLLPVYMGLVGFGNCIVAVTRKTSATIAVYLLSIVLLATVIQSITTVFPASGWLAFLDPVTACKTISAYWLQSAGYTVLMIFIWLAFAAITTIIGLLRYMKEDITKTN